MAIARNMFLHNAFRCTCCETTELYVRFKGDIDDQGTLVLARLKHEKVRSPSFIGPS